MTCVHLQIVVSGNARDRGLQYGRKAKERIEKNLSFYQSMFLNGYGIDWESAKVIAKKFEPFIADYYPEGLEEMHAIAEGAGVSFEDILALNCRSEIIFAQPDGCSCIGALPEHTENGHTLLGQNWDWLGAAGASTTILELHQDDAPTILMIVEAGMIGGKGLNSCGVGVCLNAMSIGKGQLGVPLHVMYRQILNSDSISNAFNKIAKAKRAGSGTFNIGSAEGFLASVEFTPFDWDALMIEDMPLCHTNHYLSPLFKDQDTFKNALTDTYIRLNQMRRLVKAQGKDFDEKSLFAVLSNHANYPDSICSHEDPDDTPFARLCTVYSMMMDLTDRRLWVTNGSPCKGETSVFELNN